MPEGNTIQLDFRNCDPAIVGKKLGIDTTTIESFADNFTKALAQMKRWDEDGEYGFLSLPIQTEAVDNISGIIDTIPAGIDTFLHLGIGGSSLGPIAIQKALDNELQLKGESLFNNVIIHENVDPEGLALTLSEIDLSRTIVNVVSKSGGTIETLATFSIILRKMKECLSSDQISERTIICTENPQGVLSGLAGELKAHVMPLPGNVGGRFSVLTAVGLLPATAMGINPRRLLSGAAVMRQQCFNATGPHDPCFLFALIPYLLAQRGVYTHVLFPYSDLLGGFALWCRQLIAESLGKRLSRSGEVIHVGQTPIASIGSVDQHSLLQLYMEGPDDKFFTFFEIEKFRSDESLEDMPHPGLEPQHKKGLSLGRLINAELSGTADALAQAGRPSVTIRIAELTPETLGQLFYFFELSTAYAAELYNIDAFDQPGVEASKKLTLRYLRGEQ